MKTYILRDPNAVQPQNRKPNPRPNPLPAARPKTAAGTALFTGLDVHNDTIAVSLAPSDSTELRRYGIIGGQHDDVLKLFKNIPKSDIEMLLPGTQVRMSLVDKGKIWLPTLSGVGFTLFKLVQGAAAVAFASLQGTLAFLALLSGVFGYGLRSFYGYLNTRDRYHLNLTRSLYF